MKRILFFITYITIPLISQTSDKIDSLINFIKLSKHDTSRFNAYINIGNFYQNINPDSALFYYDKAEILSENISDNHSILRKIRCLILKGKTHEINFNFKKAIEYYQKGLAVMKINLSYPLQDRFRLFIADIFFNLGHIYYYHEKINKTLLCYFQSLKEYKNLQNKPMIASSLVNIGTIYLRKGNYAKSLEYMFNALKLNEELGNKKLMASNLGNIGIIYTEQGYLEKAVQYQIRALNINEEINNKPEQAINLGNLGTVYLYQAELLLRNKKTVQSFKKYNLAFNCFQEALKINLEFDNLLGQANNYSNLGVILEIQGDSARGKGNNSLWQKKYFMAMKYYQKAMEINRKLNNQREMAANLANIAGLLFNQKKIVESLKYLEKAKKIYLDLNDIYNLEGIHSLFIEIFEQSGRFKDALIHFKEQIKYRDSIFNQENQKAAIQKELQYNFDKEQALKEKEHLKKIELEKKEKEKQRIVTLCIFAGLLSVLGFLGFVINRLHFTRKQKKIIEEQTHIVEMQKIIVEDQKKLVEQKNKDILDSINYAGKIQNAILPSPLKLKEHLSDFFVLYLPKDIVAGDFYWMEHYDKYVFLAVADCTGHGVPGAMVSVVCSNALTKAVLEEKQIETDQILNRTKELVIEKLTSEENIRDGMDVVLVRIEKGKNTIQFSGANRPLYIVDHELIFSEVKPDKQPIGYYEESGKFTKNEIELSKNSIIFLTTDGYADQFGGEKSKKLGTKKFKELLCDVARYHKTEEQKEKLISFLNKWKSAEEQIDDVTIIGIWL